MWVTREIDVDAEQAWALLVDVRCWPQWGPTVAEARLDGGDHLIGSGSRGRLRPAVGPWVPFVIDRFDPGRLWSWRVAGIPATSHRVEPLGDGHCRVGLAVPPLALPYAAVCAVALRRIAALIEPP